MDFDNQAEKDEKNCRFVLVFRHLNRRKFRKTAIFGRIKHPLLKTVNVIKLNRKSGYFV